MPRGPPSPRASIRGRGEAESEERRSPGGLSLGAEGYLLKPVDLRLVHAKLEAVLKALS